METSNDRIGKPLVLIGTFAVLSLAYFVGTLVYNAFFHPLSKIPGPKLNALSRVPYIRHLLKGSTVDNAVDLHKRFGEVVRISPNEVSFTSGETAWPEIYGFRTGKMKGHLNMQKDPVWYPRPLNGAPSILIANDDDHARGRRILSHAFSEKALSEQELLLQQYVDQLVDRLKEVTSQSSQPQDMTKWYNWITFDIIADLMFGEPFGCLQDLSTHKYITLLFRSMMGFKFGYILSYWPWAKKFGSLIIDPSALEKRKEFLNWIHGQVEKRIERETQRPDFMTHILAHNGEKGATLSRDEIDSNANLILVAGSETTATLLSGVTYCLLTNPDKMEKLKQEVRGRWNDYNDITLAEVNNAPYLLAVLNEALRYFPPVPAGFERRVGKGGEFVSGYYLPEGTAVSVSQYPAYHSESNFKNAESFVPERWMDTPEYANDKKSVLQPFSFGPRNCIGKNLAYAEMRLILAKVIWSFDMQLDPQDRDWVHRCNVMTLWNKPPLNVHVKEVVR
ncbi:hypothetical protein M409DRAFT_62676 [Zasmidium cellare ATCC 36951]|uniref:Cytochrome P450 monooxygenase n=1 Tax=Zasmidium cellare ATCC 36951 TaxID=1080233 RepID=A0A6A6D0Q5_ZASCE|nr:uncharacterized protein M409DRAFT_62676 [Zasmidium cellare ATCC 36951]KAF2173047.1 hypothetical protein M409DRAFT_62676 [Zasmidium cellare ATCC 36951]